MDQDVVPTHKEHLCLDPNSIEIKQLDHLGIVATAIKELRLSELINQLLGEHEQHRVSMGDRVGAMILNYLAYGNRALYLTPEFFGHIAIEALLGPVSPKALNDDALGKCLDKIHSYGAASFFQSLSLHMLTEHSLWGSSLRLDSTSFSLEGEYECSQGSDCSIKVTHGYSKDHRQDLKQVMLALVTTGAANMPALAIPQDGNTSDKEAFSAIIKKYAQHAHLNDKVWIADSALYKKSWLEHQNQIDILWVTRVPETIREAKKIISEPATTISWVELDKGYKAAEYTSNYGGLEQSWVLYFSFQAYKKEAISLQKKVAGLLASAEKEVWHLSCQLFNCEQDAKIQVDALAKTLKFIKVTHVNTVKKARYASSGRPKKGEEPTGYYYKITLSVAVDEVAVAEALQSCGRFILATNALNQFSPAQLLQAYKSLQGTERGFRFLKDKEFIANRFFVKNDHRIEALLTVMSLALFVHGYVEHIIRKRLKHSEVTIYDPDNKALPNPTAKRIYQIMACVGALKVGSSKCPYVIAKLTQKQQEILTALGPDYMAAYGLAMSSQVVEGHDFKQEAYQIKPPSPTLAVGGA